MARELRLTRARSFRSDWIEKSPISDAPGDSRRTMGKGSSHGCESWPGDRILEQATRGAHRPKCLNGSAGASPVLLSA
ncbi:hypothetical protein N7468_005194 [Penicillium chermesinum]|uniref:Uncharacterized protein n=1 Tax=Penicillium chermesinum TaxID=63820 RepID=A0A9W9TN54_9EURO|nr:uncharacterized protein N7468_005194 [Penicillium chermesinum]KAJ5232238.1 hypothetical protein N7468_005194 [Penicillium chermesinum]